MDFSLPAHLPVPRVRPGQRRPAPSVAALPAAALGVAALLGACAADEPTLSVAATEGHRIAADAGCWSCHGIDGSGGVAPDWNGLAGSAVPLSDGSTATADEEYLHRSILDPEADVVEGYNLVMPANDLSPEEASAVVAYIMELK